MLSLIICSREADISQGLKENIRETIGIQYELIVIDNSKNDYTIFTAYNEGIRRSKFSYLCFMHEDILFHSKDWGGKVVSYFQKESKVGLIGVIGGHFIPNTPSTWFSTRFCSGTILQGVKTNGGKYEVFRDERNANDSNLSIETVAVDGLWFCIPRIMFNNISFDNDTYKGWHAYDIDICMQVIDSGFEVRVITDILIEHSSYGNVDRSFYIALKRFNKKWKDRLPIIRGQKISEDEQSEAREKAQSHFQFYYKRTFKLYNLYLLIKKRILVLSIM